MGAMTPAEGTVDEAAVAAEAEQALEDIARIKTETAKVKEALDRLVNEGFVVELQGKDSRVHYRINQSMRKKIAKLLKDAGEDT